MSPAVEKLDSGPSPTPQTAKIVTIAAGHGAQLFCYHVTRAKGLDTESPRGLRKVTPTH